ncbi:hypothetical protein MJ563_17685 [Klebsiella pneumoniae]|nr:hypothetical protein MJ563_17685 [Klebsiella pneumoniae]
MLIAYLEKQQQENAGERWPRPTSKVSIAKRKAL